MATEHGPIIGLTAVDKSYAAPDGAPAVQVLRAASLVVRNGESLAIVGPSGSGKSTILNLLGGLDRADAGQVRLLGRDLAQLSAEELAAFRNQQVGFVFQAHHLLPHCTALENAILPALAGGSEVPQETVDRARTLLERVGLGHRMGHLPGRLSGGERQRCALVRALINRPSVLLADEPTGALDRASAEEVAALLIQLNREQGVTLVVVTHSLALANRLGRVVEVREGKLMEGPRS